MTTIDRLKGMLYGGALGDALGAPHEFRRYRHNYSYTGRLEHYLSTHNRYTKKWKRYDIGQVTDDTEMAICLLESLLENNMVYNQEKTILKYLEWANSNNNCMGNNTRKLFKGVRTIRGYNGRYKKVFLTELDREKSQSNGPMMRCGILSILKFKSSRVFRHVIQEDCYITNPSGFTYECNYVLLSAIHEALCGMDKEKIMRHALKRANRNKIIKALTKSQNLRYVDVDTKSKGWCLNALYITFYVLMKFDNYKDAMDYIVNENGDTDTNACIAGYLLGAYYGFNCIMQDPITKTNIKIMLECDTSRATVSRPSKYHMKNYLTESNFKKIYDYIMKKN